MADIIEGAEFVEAPETKVKKLETVTKAIIKNPIKTKLQIFFGNEDEFSELNKSLKKAQSETTGNLYEYKDITTAKDYEAVKSLLYYIKEARKNINNMRDFKVSLKSIPNI